MDRVGHALAPIKRRRGLDTALTKGRENLAKLNIFTCNWTLFPVMDTVEAARFTTREGFAGIEDEVAWTPRPGSAMVIEDFFIQTSQSKLVIGTD
jgi:hypothetical protein